MISPNVNNALFLMESGSDSRYFVQHWRKLSPQEKQHFAKICTPQQYSLILKERKWIAQKINNEQEIIMTIHHLQRERLNPTPEEKRILDFKYNTFHSEALLLDFEEINQQIGNERNKVIIDHIPKGEEIQGCMELLKFAYRQNYTFEQFHRLIPPFILNDADLFHLFKISEKEKGDFGNFLRAAVRVLFYENWEVLVKNPRENPDSYSKQDKVQYVINSMNKFLSDMAPDDPLFNKCNNILNRYLTKKLEIERTGSTKLPHYHHFCETLEELLARLRGQIPFDIPTNYYQGAYVSNQPTTSYGDYGIALEEKIHFKYGIEDVTKNEFLDKDEFDEGKVGWIGFTTPISILKEKNREELKLSCVYIILPNEMTDIPDELAPYIAKNCILKKHEFFLELRLLRQLHKGHLPIRVSEF